MKTISSPAGERLADARHKVLAAEAEYQRIERREFKDEQEELVWLLKDRRRELEPVAEAEREFLLASIAVADELIANGHGQAQGD